VCPKVDENLSTTLARNKLPVVAPEAMALLHARTHARAQAAKAGSYAYACEPSIPRVQLLL
jgi:hypothetical protein